MLSLSCDNMKIANADKNGPILPVWQSLKGIDNKSLIPEPSDPKESCPDSHNVVTATKLARVASCPTNSSLKRDSVEHNRNMCTKSYSEIERRHDSEAQLIQSFPSSSAEINSLSQQNNTVQSNSHYASEDSLVSSTEETLKDEAEEEADSDNQQIFNFLKDIPLYLFTDVYRQTRVNSRKMRQRIVQKTGECNVTPSNVAKRRKRYLQDIFTTLVDIQWRWTLLIFTTSFLMSWLMFAFVWYAIALFHGDLSEEHSPENQDSNGWTPCVINIASFTSCFLFSVETQHTIGYGSRYTTEECPEAILVVCLQCITGVMIQAFMVGVVFAKLSRPKKRTQTLLFSSNACICQRDGELCLIFRVGDMRKSHIIEAHIRAVLIRRKITEEGEVIPFFHYELNVGYDVGEDRIFFIWPVTLVHKIDETSPLYNLSAHDLLREKFEIVVMLEGVIESTGMTTQARSSYLPSEVLWGYRFESLIFFNKDTGEYAIDYSLFNNSRQVSTPLCSAKHLQECKIRDSKSVSPVTTLTQRTSIAPLSARSSLASSITSSVPVIEEISRSRALSNVSFNKLCKVSSKHSTRSSSRRSSTDSSSSTLKDCPSCVSSEDGQISQKYSSLSEVIISQPLINATNQL